MPVKQRISQHRQHMYMRSGKSMQVLNIQWQEKCQPTCRIQRGNSIYWLSFLLPDGCKIEYIVATTISDRDGQVYSIQIGQSYNSNRWRNIACKIQEKSSCNPRIRQVMRNKLDVNKKNTNCRNKMRHMLALINTFFFYEQRFVIMYG